MAITQLYTAIAGDTITAARWNNEFGNIYNNLVPLLNNYDSLNLKDDYAAVGDGTTSDQSAVASAVAAALAAGKDLYWPAGTYKTTASIASFHSVTHWGPGILKRGSDLFYVDPSRHPGVSNNLYVATTGSDANDGLSATEPRLTVLSMGNVIYNYPWSNCTWKINIAAGTYTASTSFSKAFPSDQNVQFVGVSVADGVTPTTIFNSPGGAAQVGLYLQNGVLATITNIKFTNYKDGGGVSGSGSSSGITADTFCQLYCRNVWLDTCDVGLYATVSVRLRYQAGVISNNGIGIKNIFFVTFSIGYNGTLADVTGASGTAFVSNVTGVLVQENSTGHTDTCYFSACSTGVFLTVSSRTNAVSSVFDTCSIGLEADFLSCFANSNSTFTGCTTNVVMSGGSVQTDLNALNDDRRGRQGFYYTDTSDFATQSTSPVSVYSKTLYAYELQNREASLKVRISGRTTGVVNTKVVAILMNAVTLATFTAAAGTGFYVIELEFFTHTASNLIKMNSQFFQNGVLPVVSVSNLATVDLTIDQTLSITHNVTNAADTNTINSIEVKVTR